MVVQVPSHVWLFVSPWTAGPQTFLSLTISWSLPKIMSIELVMPFNHLCHPLLFPPSIFPSIKVFSNESVLCIRWLKYRSFSFSFSFSISPSNELFRVDFLWDWLVWSLCVPRHSEESFPASHFESISSLTFNLLYGSTLTSGHDYWKNHSPS